ncbi:MAG: divalent-cation tolerance protein CutA [Planctomycetota bacterium]|nr:MAG: divalent-cation tolerance protein CutA [Planctomycetota bacterium]REJ96653.1 MAG: divalent-cation tolerance protein CutA [Planctomycetota bacterium]REK23274.1 MAG: divalent-cation tolerance protein CutA [Planctomycetota bacterium]REK30804.1 MAG: divalent-cation tolerance protein CutA [Planctomycetota bacterium]
MSAVVCYITAPDRDEALKIGRALVEERLVACANVLDGMTSIYRWEGAIQQDSEVVLIAKTRHELSESVIERVRELHSYDCPCVIAWPITAANPDYLQWIEKEAPFRRDMIV